MNVKAGYAQWQYRSIGRSLHSLHNLLYWRTDVDGIYVRLANGCRGPVLMYIFVETAIVARPRARGAPCVGAVWEYDGHSPAEGGVWRGRDLRTADAEQGFRVCLCAGVIFV
jgi:hypothetical protein